MSNTPIADAVRSSTLKASSPTRIVAVTSGHTGVGKTNLVVNTAVELALRRCSVMVLGADPNELHAGILLGVNSPRSIKDVILKKCSLAEAIVQTEYGVQFLSVSDGMEELAQSETSLLEQLELIEQKTNFVLIDAPSGITDQTMNFLKAASEVVIVTGPESNAVVDTYATVKVLHTKSPTKPISIMVNSVIGLRDGDEIFKQLSTITTRFLNRSLEYLGAVPEDDVLSRACKAHQPVVRYAPDVSSSRSLRVIANAINNPKDYPFSSFWRNFAIT